ncbi:helix-turn-helix transcriptional regulator [Patescibacteria group bacterium]|nr:helix-turn-helix transcriptional regulator [Patescibacteria group bacterium]
MYSFPEFLKKIREESQLTQEDLAKVLGVSTVLVSMIETGQKEVSKKFIKGLAKKMRVSAASITPFIFMEKDDSFRYLSDTERSFIKFAEKLQIDLINIKAKNLRRYV